MIAYRTKNTAGDEWHDHAFLFKNYKAVEKFFTAENTLLRALFCDVMGVGFEPIQQFTVHRDSSKDQQNSDRITSVTFYTFYSGKVEIIEMFEGHVVK